MLPCSGLVLNVYSGLDLADFPADYSTLTLFTTKSVKNVDCALAPSTCFVNAAGQQISAYFAAQVCLGLCDCGAAHAPHTVHTGGT